MFTINSTNRVASTIAPYACVSDVNLEDKATFLDECIDSLEVRH